jgi:hypothetical protein
MPTALPISHSALIVVPSKFTGSLHPAWLIVPWAITMLLVGALVHTGVETGAKDDPFQTLATF